jgi:putative CocE/NonD family hydrolase
MWGPFTNAMDLGQFGEKYLTGIQRQVFKGVRRVEEDRDGSMLAAAIRDHARNYDLISYIHNAAYRDYVGPTGYGADNISPFAFQRQIQDSGVPIYNYGGWYDAAYPHSAVKRFMTIHTSGSKLILGPWNHGGDANLSPFSKDHEQFDRYGVLLRFFDHYLKGVNNGIEQDQPVRYYTLGEEAWKSADSWPPPGTEPVIFYFGPGRSLVKEKPTSKQGQDNYPVDITAGTGKETRWNSMVYMDKAGLQTDRTEQDKKLFTYMTAPLPQAVEVTGHPIITFYITSTATDGSFFVYLEDVDEQGKATYVTEGMLRAIHRQLSKQSPPYRTVAPYRTYRRADSAPLVPGKIAELTFDLQPISYLFKQGHSIRVAIAGADRDHFTTIPDDPATVSFYRSAAAASHLVLPLMKHR